ncbi:MAG TPA: Holliday junction resolvase RuvX [Candidatus Limnocylindrales bacterium]
MTRLLGVDLGERRIGLALADRDGSAAHPLATIRRSAGRESDVTALRIIVRRYDVDELVVGLPLEAAGDEGPQAALTRAWATAVADRLALPLVLRDERLSSHLAETRLGPMKRGRSGGPPSKVQRDAYRARVDREAATIILQDELDARAAAAAASKATR